MREFRVAASSTPRVELLARPRDSAGEKPLRSSRECTAGVRMESACPHQNWERQTPAWEKDSTIELAGQENLEAEQAHSQMRMVCAQALQDERRRDHRELRDEVMGFVGALQEQLAALSRRSDDAGTQLASVLKHVDSTGGGYESRGPLMDTLQRLGQSQDALVERQAELQAGSVSMGERLGLLERQLGGVAEKTGKEMTALRDAFSRHGVEGLKDLHARVGTSDDRLRGLHSKANATDERLRHLEESIGAAVGKHADDLAELRHAQDRIERSEAARVEGACRQQCKELFVLRADLDKQARVFATHALQLAPLVEFRQLHATLPERVAMLEQQLGKSTDKCAAEVAALSKHIAKEVAARDRQHAQAKDLITQVQDERCSRTALHSSRSQETLGGFGGSAIQSARLGREIGHRSLGRQRPSSASQLQRATAVPQLTGRPDNGALRDEMGRLEGRILEAMRGQAAKDVHAVHPQLTALTGQLAAAAASYGSPTMTPRSTSTPR